MRFCSVSLAVLAALLVGLPAAAQITPDATAWVSFKDVTNGELKLTAVFADDDAEKDIAIGDLNRDGWLDAVVARKNVGYGSGLEDLLLLNRGGTLVDVTATKAPEFLTDLANARDVAIIDFNGDGWLDVHFSLTGFQGARIYINQGVGLNNVWLGLVNQTQAEFNGMSTGHCAGTAGDVDGDGFADVLMPRYAGSPDDRLFLNDGTANFTEALSQLGAVAASAFAPAVEINDMNGDGHADIIKVSTTDQDGPPPAPPAALGDHGVFILYNDGNDQFDTSPPQHTPDFTPGAVDGNPEAAYHATTGDLNGDYLPDIYAVADAQDRLSLSMFVGANGQVVYDEVGLSNATSPRTANPGGNVHLADIDGDGDLDAGVSPVNSRLFDPNPDCDNNPTVTQFALLQGNGFGRLHDPFANSNQNIHIKPWDFAFFDINRDGCMDIFMGLCADGYKVFYQKCPASTLPAP